LPNSSSELPEITKDKTLQEIKDSLGVNGKYLDAPNEALPPDSIRTANATLNSRSLLNVKRRMTVNTPETKPMPSSEMNDSLGALSSKPGLSRSKERFQRMSKNSDSLTISTEEKK